MITDRRLSFISICFVLYIYNNMYVCVCVWMQFIFNRCCICILKSHMYVNFNYAMFAYPLCGCNSDLTF